MTNSARITQLEVTDMAIRVSPPGTRGTRIPKPLLKLFKPMGALIRFMRDDHDLLPDR